MPNGPRGERRSAAYIGMPAIVPRIATDGIEDGPGRVRFVNAGAKVRAESQPAANTARSGSRLQIRGENDV